MQCVIIAAGKGTRMRPLTETTAKPLIEVCGKTILDHIAEALPSEIDELIFVVGYRQEQIREYCGSEFHGKKVQYIEQENFAGGTGAALHCAKHLITGKFLFMYADDIHGPDALARLVKEDSAVVCLHSDTPELFGVIEKNADGTLKEIIEKPEDPTSNFVYIGGFVVDPSIFDYNIEVSERLGELIVTDMLTAYAADHPVKIIEQDFWLPIGYPEHIEAAEKVLCPQTVDSNE